MGIDEDGFLGLSLSPDHSSYFFRRINFIPFKSDVVTAVEINNIAVHCSSYARFVTVCMAAAELLVGRMPRF
jgi:hypothetical protein